MIEVVKEDYLRIAEVLKQELEGREFFNGRVEVQVGGREVWLGEQEERQALQVGGREVRINGCEEQAVGCEEQAVGREVRVAGCGECEEQAVGCGERAVGCEEQTVGCEEQTVRREVRVAGCGECKEQAAGREVRLGEQEEGQALRASVYEAALVATLIVYRERVEEPEGERFIISDVVPVWWEFNVYDGEGFELFNDFSFNELRKLIGRRC